MQAIKVVAQAQLYKGVNKRRDTASQANAHILLRQPGLDEAVLNRKQRLDEPILFTLEKQTQQVRSIHVWKVLSQRHLQQNRLEICQQNINDWEQDWVYTKA